MNTFVFGSMALNKQQRRVRRLIKKNPEMDWREICNKCGYTNPGEAAKRLRSNPAFMAELSAEDVGTRIDVVISEDYVNSILVEIVEHAMEEGPIIMWDEVEEKHVQVGYRELDAKNARETAKLLGMNIGMFQKQVKIEHGGKIMHGKLPESLRTMIDEEYADKD